MSEQAGTLAKLSKSQKKKKAAQKKKLAKRADKAIEEQKAAEREERIHDEIDARLVERHHDEAMKTRNFQMLNIHGKLLAHPSQSFLEALTNFRQALGRETYPNRISHAQRLYHFGINNVHLPSWSVAMGTASYVPIQKFFLETKEESTEENPQKGTGGDNKVTMFRFAEPVEHGRIGAFTDQSYGALGLMVWYPIFAMCMAVGDKLACIALRDTCVVLKTCYALFRNDTTRLEQFVFNTKNPESVKQLDWVARRLEVPISPPQTPSSCPTRSESLLTKDPFRSPTVVTKRWADYDDDDESLGSPMSLPITPESSSDVPVLDLAGESSDGSDIKRGRPIERRTPTTVIAVPTLTDSAPWFSTIKTVLPVARLSVLIPEDCPRSQHTTSLNPMKIQSSTFRYMPGTTGSQRVRARLEHWVREDAEKKLKAKFSLSGPARKQAEAKAESLIYNRMAALAGLSTGETVYYIGEPDILGAGNGVCVDDVRDIVTGRYKGRQVSREGGAEVSLRKEDTNSGRVVLIPSVEGWICKPLNELQP